MKQEGDLAEIQLLPTLVDLGRDWFTGAIRFELDSTIKIVYLKDGDLISASTSDRTESIDELLLRSGTLNREQLRQVLASRREDETIGDALLRCKVISRDALTEVRRDQLVSILRSVTRWTAGTYAVVGDYLPRRDEGTVFKLPEVLLELLLTESDEDKIATTLDFGRAVLSQAETFSEIYPTLGLSEEADEIVRMLDGRRSVDDIAATLNTETPTVHKLLYGLTVLNLTQRREELEGTTEVSPSLQPDVAGADTGFEGSTSEDENSIWDSAEPDAKALLTGDEWLGGEADPAVSPLALEHTEDGGFAVEDVTMFGDSEAPDTSAESGALSFGGDLEIDDPQISSPAQVSTSTGGATDLFGDVSNSDAAAGEHQNVSSPLARTPVKRPSWMSGSETVVTPEAPGSEGSHGGGEGAWSASGESLDPAGVDLVPDSDSSPRTLWIALALLAPLALVAIWFFAFRPNTQRATEAKSSGTRAARTVPVAPIPVVTPQPQAGLDPLTSSAPPVSIGTDTTGTGATETAALVTPAAGSAGPATPGGAVLSASDQSLRTRYDAMATDFLNKSTPDEFTIQFELVCETSSVTRALEVGGENVWFVPSRFSGRNCFKVYWGHFQSRAEAAAAINRIPSSLRGSQTAIVKPKR